jgi:2'-5' RNA ligase
VPRPPRGRARLYALPIESEELLELQADVEGKLVEAGLFEPEKRPFWPHLTVARVRPERGGGKRPRRVEKPPEGLSQELLRPTKCVRVSAYRSELKPQGATYVPVAQTDLR